MRKRYQYSTKEERESLIEYNSDLILVEDQDIVEGKFLIFSDTDLEREIIYINVPKNELSDVKTTNEDLANYILDVDMRLIMIELGI